MHRIGRVTRIGLFLALCGIATIVACESGPGNLLPNDTPNAGSDSNGGDPGVDTASGGGSTTTDPDTTTTASAGGTTTNDPNAPAGGADTNAPSVVAVSAATVEETAV
ncbi:MAG: hypothetical protein ACE5EX_05935, partial [Phycisphaerae bacterium]